jgi:hypothetical protein
VRKGRAVIRVYWLSWTGDTSDSALVASLTPPGTSATYVNPADPTDHVLAAGKSVAGRG